MANLSDAAPKPGNLIRAVAKGNKTARSYRASKVSGGRVTEMFEGWFTEADGTYKESQTAREAEKVLGIVAEKAPAVGSKRPAAEKPKEKAA